MCLLSDRCLKFMGSRHPTLVLPLVPELLSTHPYFDTPEPDMDDPACILPKHTHMNTNRNLILEKLTHEGKVVPNSSIVDSCRWLFLSPD